MDSILQKVAEHIGRPIDSACWLIENVLGEPTKRLGDLLGEQIVYWQWLNRVRIAGKVAARLAQKGVHPRQLPLDFAVPFLRECGDSENPDLQDWWAEMLVSAIDEESLCHKAFIKALESMSATDVQFLDALLRIARPEKAGRLEAVAAASGMSLATATVSLHNLRALGFFNAPATRLSGFAYDFLNACCPHRDLIAPYKEKESKLPQHLLRG